MYLNRSLASMKYDNIPYRACVKVRSIWCLTSLYSKEFAGFWPSTCKREPAFSNETSTLGTVFENRPFIVSENAVFGRFSGKREVKISFLKNIRILVDGARKRINALQVEDIHFVIDLNPSDPPPPPPANLSFHPPHSKTIQHYEGVEAAWYFQFPWKFRDFGLKQLLSCI